MQGVVLVGLFFALDLKGSFYGVENSNVDYWAHVGGYLAGIWAAYHFGMQKEAVDESILYKARKLCRDPCNRKEAVEKYQEVLKKDPGNIQALEYLLSVSSCNMEKSDHYYSRLMRELVKGELSHAIELFDEYFPHHVNALHPSILVKLGIYYFRKNEHEKAMMCLEFASIEPGPWQAKALTLLAESYVGIDNMAMACKTWEKIMLRFAETPFAVEAQKNYKAVIS